MPRGFTGEVSVRAAVSDAVWEKPHCTRKAAAGFVSGQDGKRGALCVGRTRCAAATNALKRDAAKLDTLDTVQPPRAAIGAGGQNGILFDITCINLNIWGQIRP